MVWSFRHFSRARSHISDFEYLGFSTFWGVLILSFYEWLVRSRPDLIANLISQPYAGGVILAVLGFIIGFGAGRIKYLLTPR